VKWTAVNLQTYEILILPCTEHDLSAKIGNELNWRQLKKYTLYLLSTLHSDIKIYLRTCDLSTRIGGKLNWTAVSLKRISYTYWVEHTDIKLYLRNDLSAKIGNVLNSSQLKKYKLYLLSTMYRRQNVSCHEERDLSPKIRNELNSKSRGNTYWVWTSMFPSTIIWLVSVQCSWYQDIFHPKKE